MQRDNIVIEPPAELDPRTAPMFAEQLLAVPPDVDIVIDMSSVRFCDSKGIAAIVSAINHRDCGAQVIVRNPSAFVRRVLRIVGLDHFLTIDLDCRNSRCADRGTTPRGGDVTT